jgi:Domain of unknown function (DUF1996)
MRKWIRGAMVWVGMFVLVLVVSCGSGNQQTGNPPPTPPPVSPPPSPPNPSPTTINWIKCADEFAGTCSYAPRFSGLREMRFGSRVSDQWVYKSFFGGLGGESCNARAFGATSDVAPGEPKECQYADFYKTTALPAPTNNMGPRVDLNKIPLGHPGYSSQRIQAGGVPAEPSGDGVGAFRIICMYSHMNFDDPIVYPGQVGRSHLHTFFGNTRTNAASNVDSIELTGNSTCFGGTANRSAYWIPSLIDTRDGTPLPPFHAIFYYKSGYRGVDAKDIITMPRGLRMLAGNPSATTLSQATEFGRWSCNGVTSKSIPTNCPVGSELEFQLDFPQCWNGVDLDSPDHRSHMAYATPGVGCPSSHPKPIPVISFNIFWDVTETNATTHWRLSSDMYTNAPGGYSMHGDWFNGWNRDIEDQWIKHCVQPPGNCSNVLGNGNTLEN